MKRELEVVFDGDSSQVVVRDYPWRYVLLSKVLCWLVLDIFGRIRWNWVWTVFVHPLHNNLWYRADDAARKASVEVIRFPVDCGDCVADALWELDTCTKHALWELDTCTKPLG